MNKIKIALITLIGLMILTSCKSIKSGLSGRKDNNSDEFLVQKKKPLTMPPKFEKLPIPIDENEVNKVEKENDIQTLIMSSSKKKSKQTSKNQSVENFILEKIKKD